VEVDEIEVDAVYTWPTAPVNVMSVLTSCTTDGQTSVSSEIWYGTDKTVVNSLDIIRSACP
jgi:hypothetical protein